MITKLYHHKTDRGAEYLCTSPIEGTDEGDLYTAVIRLDGEPELIRPIKSPDLLKVLKAAERLLKVYSTWIGKTSNERELINTIKLALELVQKAIKENS